jgi:hypothetical protein
MYADENIWLSQKRMAELFGCSIDNISLHLKNIYREKELDPQAGSHRPALRARGTAKRRTSPHYSRGA